MQPIVLIVDDKPTNVELVKVLLEMEGYRILTASSGREGVTMALKCLPDLILMDIMMPEMDGLEATRRIKKNARTSGIPVVALTSCAMRGDKSRIRDAGCDGYVSKPINIDEFLEKIKGILDVK